MAIFVTFRLVLFSIEILEGVMKNRLIKSCCLVFVGLTGFLGGRDYLKKRLCVSQKVSFCDLVNRSNDFANTIRPFPTSNNRIAAIASNSKKIMKRIEAQARSVRPIASHEIKQLINGFLKYKAAHGSRIERPFYASMGFDTFIDRLLINRPLMFMNPKDDYLLRDGKTQGQSDCKKNICFDDIGTVAEKAPLVLKNYLSYDEMQIAAVMGVSVPTYFINNGNRKNRAALGQSGTFQEQGVYVGLVGARFEKSGYMEWAHMMITPEQNTPVNGYGSTPAKGRRAELLRLWACFYGVPHFYTYNEAIADKSGRFLKLSEGYLDTHVYKMRLKRVLIPFFADANDRASHGNCKAYCHVIGLGTGVWAVHSERQEELMLQVCAEILKFQTFAHISDINFSWFGPQGVGNLIDGAVIKSSENSITIHFSKRNPADRLSGVDAQKLLVAMYAWDSNAYPGNEYWVGALAASGDPAAVCSSTIAELQNPLINPAVSSKNIFFDR